VVLFFCLTTLQNWQNCPAALTNHSGFLSIQLGFFRTSRGGANTILSGCTKDEVLDQYNNIVQSTGSIALTGNLSLQGTKEKGIDDYTGCYTADYEDFSDTEYLFGGTSIKREAGKDLSIDCTLEVSEGTAKVFWLSGADEEVTLLETTGTYSDTITLPEGGNYIGIECENFTGSIELNIE